VAVGTVAATNATAVLARVASTPLQPTVHPAATVAGGQSNGGGDWGGGLGTSLGEADCSATPSAGRLADAALDAGASYSTPVSMAQVRHRAAKGARARLRCLHSCTGRMPDVAGGTHRSPQARWPTRQRARRSAPPSPPARRCSRRSTRQREGGLGGRAASGCVGPSRDAEQVGGPRVVARATAHTAVYEVDAAVECVDKARTVEFRPLTERSQARTGGGRQLLDQCVQRLWGPSAHGAVVGCRDRRRRARRCVLTNHSCASTSGPRASPG